MTASDAVRERQTTDLTVIRARRVCKSFGRVPVLRGVDLAIKRGDSTAITGPSGSGKSSLMALLGLLAHRDSGELTILGVDVPLRPSSRLIAQHRHRMAWLPQLPMAWPGRTCLDNALLGLRQRATVSEADVQFAAELFDRLGIGHLTSRDVSVLSGGELQKVALVRALVVRPDIILADEPTASLDGASTHAVIDALTNAGQLSTLVVASHDPAVTGACTTVITMRDGRVGPGPS